MNQLSNENSMCLLIINDREACLQESVSCS